MGDRLSVGDNLAVLYFASRAPESPKEWFVVHNTNPRGDACDAASVRGLYTSAEYVHEGRIEIRCTNFWSSLHDRLYGDGGGYGIDHWPGQTLPIPLAGDTKDKYDTYIMELLNCMHKEMTSGMHVPREPYPRRPTREEDGPGGAALRRWDSNRANPRRPRWPRAADVARAGRDGEADGGRGDGGYAPGRARAPTSFDRGTTKEFLKFLERVVDHYFDCVAAEPR
jgi:hypothetical protein